MKPDANLSPVGGLLARLRLVAPRTQMETNDQRDMLAAVEQAHREWEAAQSYFASVVEPELVDHAIFVLEAAQRKYRYLMKLAREHQHID